MAQTRIPGAQITATLPVTNLNSGTGASSSTYWRGDGTWATPSGGSGQVVHGRDPGNTTALSGAPVQYFANYTIAKTTATVTTMSAYCFAVSGSNTVQLGIYDTAGTTLLGSGTATVTTTGLFTVTLGASVALTANTAYWFGLVNQTNTPATTFGYMTTTSNTNINRFGAGAALPASLAAGAATAIAFCVTAY